MSFRITIKHFWNTFRFYSSYLLLAFYIVIGILFLFTDKWIDMISSGRKTIGTVIVLFGLLRFYIAYRRYKKKHARIISIKESIHLKEKKENVPTASE
jgi:hypothetical protein